MAETTERIRGDEKDEIIAHAADTLQFQAFRSYFEDEHGYTLDREDAGVVAIEKEGETYYLVTFREEDDDSNVRVEINITLHDDRPVSSKGTIEFFEDDLIDAVDVFEYDDGKVRNAGTA